jgi:hypothetical protein
MIVTVKKGQIMMIMISMINGIVSIKAVRKMIPKKYKNNNRGKFGNKDESNPRNRALPGKCHLCATRRMTRR